MKVKLLHANAKMPTRGSEGSAGFDLYSIHNGSVMPGAHVMIPTGIAVAIDPGHYGRVAPRSGLAVKYGINVHAGVIDPDYRGELSVALINHGNQMWQYWVGDRIAQLVIEKCYEGPLTQVDDLDATVRGVAGFGSTGVA